MKNDFYIKYMMKVFNSFIRTCGILKKYNLVLL